MLLSAHPGVEKRPCFLYWAVWIAPWKGKSCLTGKILKGLDLRHTEKMMLRSFSKATT